MQNGVQWNSTTSINGTVGLESKPIAVWYDTFHVALISSDTNEAQTTKVTVNVTYLLQPQNGITLHSGVDVTINGVKADQTEPNIFSANVSTVFPTAYVLVQVSKDGWTTTYTAFEFTHNANQTEWLKYASIIMLLAVASSVTLYVVHFRKPNQPTPLFSRARFPLIGGALLLIVSVVSIYWGILGLEAASHGFNWLLLAITGLGSFAAAVAGGVLSVFKKNQALVIFLACVPLLTDIVVVKASFDAYQLAVPWLIVGLSMAASTVSGLLVSNADKQFT